jgi:hypothetical protein
MTEPSLGMAGRSWKSYFGLIALFAEVVTNLVAAVNRGDDPGI